MTQLLSKVFPELRVTGEQRHLFFLQRSIPMQNLLYLYSTRYIST